MPGELPAALRDSANPAELGHCALCQQEMLRTANDCWHPYGVPVACPPEVNDRGIVGAAFGGFGRPGREHWLPGPPEPAPPSLIRPKVTKVTVEVELADGGRSRMTFLADLPDREPDSESGIELAVDTEYHREGDFLNPTRISSIRYTHRLTIEKSPAWTRENIPASPAESQRRIPMTSKGPDAIPGPPSPPRPANDHPVA